MARIDLAKTRQAGFADEQVRKFALTKGDTIYDSTPTAPATTQGKQEGGGLIDLLPLLGAIGGSFIPGAGTIAGGALGAGAGTIAKQFFTGKGDPGEVVQEAALGGIGGVAGRGIGALLGKAVPKAGVGLRQAIRSPKVAATPFAAEEEATISQTLSKLGLRGSAQAQREQSPKVFKEIGEQIKTTLEGAKVPVDTTSATKTVQNAITNSINFDPAKPEWRRILNLRTSQIANMKTPRELYEYKQTLGQQLGNAFRKLERDAQLTPQEEAGLATWKSIDDILSSLVPEVKELTLAQSALYKAAPGLAQSAKRAINIPFTNIPIPGAARGLQAGADVVGRGAEAGGRLPIPSSTMLERLGVGAGAALGGAGSPPPQGFGEAEGGEAIEGAASAPASASQADTLRQAFLLQMLANPKQANTLKTIYEFGFPNQKISAGKEKIINQANTANSILNTMEREYKRVGPTGRIVGLGQKAGQALGLNPQASAYEAIRLASIGVLARAISSEVGVLTQQDIERAEQLLPKLTDTPQEARLKFRSLREAIAERKRAVYQKENGEEIEGIFEGL